MAYPEFDIPMYKPLVDKSTELFVPNLNFIGQNTITLLKTNQPFIESYMVGLNHEFARELLWREYPTDQRGSYFRQFWDVSGFLSPTEDSKQRREELKDIPPIHRWSRFSKLGEHDHREQGLENEEELVLVIRGELLKKYPNAVIYENTVIGKRCRIHGGAVIGADGFGYAPKLDPETKLMIDHQKIYHLGRVVIEDDVEIGANSTLDRGTLGDTVVRSKVKIDNLVQVGHNVVLEELSLIHI
ncbi:MAG: hypothetical protein EBU46_17460, partial [Nitrosomonadaceae bacterium]|nr:hypothetical protein [Nitrosomonadaceae bacterium]